MPTAATHKFEDSLQRGELLQIHLRNKGLEFLVIGQSVALELNDKSLVDGDRQLSALVGEPRLSDSVDAQAKFTGEVMRSALRSALRD